MTSCGPLRQVLRTGLPSGPGPRLGSVAAKLLVLVLALSACGGDDPASPGGPDDIIRVALGDDVARALRTARPGDTVLLAPGAHEVDTTLVLLQGVGGVTLAGRQTSRDERPILEFSLASVASGIVVDSSNAEVTVEGLWIRGSFGTGIRLQGSGAVVRDCRIEDARYYSVSCAEDFDDVRIENNLLINPRYFGVHCVQDARPLIEGNTIAGSRDCGIYASDAAPVIRRNLIVHSVNYGIACFGPLDPVLSCNDVFDSGGSHYNSRCAPGDGDFHKDPLFCDDSEYGLSPGSPCAGGNTGSCGQIGAMGVVCARRIAERPVAETSNLGDERETP